LKFCSFRVALLIHLKDTLSLQQQIAGEYLFYTR